MADYNERVIANHIHELRGSTALALVFKAATTPGRLKWDDWWLLRGYHEYHVTRREH